MKLSHPLGTDISALFAWGKRLVDELNRFFPSAAELPVFDDDAAAEAGRVKIGEEYVTPDGFRKRRMA